MSSLGLGARISLFDLVWCKQKQGRAGQDTWEAGRLSGHVAGERLGIKDRGGEKSREATVDLNRVTATSPAGCGAAEATQQDHSLSYFPSDWNGRSVEP